MPTIPNLPTITTPALTDVVPASQGGVAGSTTWQGIYNLFKGVFDTIYVTTTWAVTLTNKTLTTPIIASIKGAIVTDTDGATITFDKNVWDYHRVTLGGNRILALNNILPWDKIVIDLIQDATGSRTVTWFNTIKWVWGTVPTLTTTASKIDTFGFICTSAWIYQGYIIWQNI